MSEAFYFDQLRVGDEWTSRARTVTESDVIGFAGLTGDYDPLHVDHEYASETPFGKPVAHGLLGLSFLAGLSSTCPAMNTAAFLAIRSWEFKKPIFIGDTVRVVTRVEKLEPASRRHGRVTWHRQLLNQRHEVVQEGLLETLVAVTPRHKADVSDADASQPGDTYPPRPHMMSHRPSRSTQGR